MNAKKVQLKANELRIGNWYMGASRNIPLKASGRMIAQLEEGYLVGNPIPLTEEILLKCGFVHCSIVDNHFNISGMCIWKCNDMFLCSKNGVQIKHLHQLQNLYFALTGEELEVNL